MAVPTSITDLSTTPASNSPAGSDSIGTSLDDYLRSIQAILKQTQSQGTDITAAATITPTADGSYFTVNGSTGISAIGSTNSWNGREIVLRFASTPIITHNGSSLILPGAANITAATGDVAFFRQEASGVWRCIVYQPAAGNLKSADIGVTVQGYDANTVKSNATKSFTAGYTSTDYSAGTKSTGTFTPDPANGNFQYAVNGGAHTLAPPASSCTMIIQYTNNASAGSITTSGFTKVTGLTPGTTNGDDFLAFITRINGFSHLAWQALQ